MSGESGVTGYKHAGDVDIRTLKYVSASGQVIDIEPIVVEFSVYQSITEHYLQCDLVLNDSIGLVNTINDSKGTDIQGGFSGGDMLIVSYKTNTPELPYVNHMFALHELTDRRRLEERSEVYFLSGISVEAYSSSGNKISRAYGGSSGSDISSMVSSVVDEFILSAGIKNIQESYRKALKISLQKNNDIDETVGNHKFIIPNLSVDDTIQFLCAEADSADHIPYFFFYENNNGFNFKNLGSLVSQDVKQKYQYIPSNFTETTADFRSDDYTESSNIISFLVLKQNDYLENLENGLFKSKTIQLDILKKNKNEVNYNYENYFPKFKKLQRFKIAGSVESGDPVIRMVTSRDGHQSDKIFENENPTPKKIGSTVAQSESYYTHIFNTCVEVAVPGDTNINVGDVIYLSIPPATNVKDQLLMEDKYLSGKYLVTKVRNKIIDGSDMMTTIAECVKDTSTKQ